MYTQLISVYDTVGKKLDEDRQADMIFLYFSKAFDLVKDPVMFQTRMRGSRVSLQHVQTVCDDSAN